MSNSVEPPSAEQIREAIRREHETLRRIVAYIDEGTRNGRIDPENAEMLIAAAEAAHAAALHPLHRQLSDRLRGDQDAGTTPPGAH